MSYWEAAPESKNTRTKRTTAVVNLGLWQIKRVFRFNIARAHIVADGVAHDCPVRIDQQRQLWLRHRPLRVRPNAKTAFPGLDHAATRRLEKSSGSSGVIDALVAGASSRSLVPRLRRAAATVSHARGPHLLADHGCENCGGIEPSIVAFLPVAAAARAQTGTANNSSQSASTQDRTSWFASTNTPLVVRYSFTRLPSYDSNDCHEILVEIHVSSWIGSWKIVSDLLIRRKRSRLLEGHGRHSSFKCNVRLLTSMYQVRWGVPTCEPLTTLLFW
jgi:hypothetical protein